MKFQLALSSLIGAITVVDAAVVAPRTKPYSQDNEEQFNLLRYTGTTGPYISHKGYGISREVPYQCEVTQAHLVMRHGERYATKGTGKAQKTIFDKLKSANVSAYKGPLAFVEDWEYFTPDSARYETESDKGWYSGLATGYNLGTQMRSEYAHLYNGDSIHPIFSSGQERVVDTARAFGKGFFGANYTNLGSLQVIPEEETQGANTLTSHDACVNYNGSFHSDIVGSFSQDYLKKAAIRLNTLSPGFNITASDVYDLMGYCGFEMNVVGFSPVCEVFNTEEWVSFAYSKSLDFYYGNGPGYNLSTPLGYVLANSTYTLLNQGKDYPYNLTFSFTHDSDIVTFTTALGLFEPDFDLSPDFIEHDTPFRAGEIAPMGGRVITERLDCFDILTNTTGAYARVIVNDAVIPIPSCQSGPGFSCPLEGFKENIDSRLGDTTYVEACGVNSTYPQYTSFFWDWKVTFDDN